MPETEAAGDGNGCRTENLQFRENTLVLKADRGHDGWCDAETVQGDLVFVRFLVTMQKTTGELHIPELRTHYRPTAAGIQVLAGLSERVIKPGKAINPSLGGFEFEVDQLLVVDMLGVRVPVLGI